MFEGKRTSQTTTMAKRNGYLLRGGRNSKLLEIVYNHRMVPVGDGLDIEHVVLVLAEAIPQFCPDHDLVQMARYKAQHLALKYGGPHGKQGGGPSLSDDDLEDVAMILEDFLGSTNELPPNVVAYVHTYIGLVRQYQERYASAIVSLLKALWILKSSRGAPDRLAVSCYRLGLVYGLAGDFNEATTLLKRAIDYYDEASVAKDHHFVVVAKKALEIFEQKKSLCSQKLPNELPRPSLKLRSVPEGDIGLLSPELC